jgi:predicted outer membrane lipoprotein
MKRAAWNHLKTRNLAKALGIPRPYAFGILEALMHLCAKVTPRGNIGALSPEEIVKELDCPQDPQELIAALVKTGWLDKDRAHKLVVHDWHEHADDGVRKTLEASGLTFVGGHPPRRPKGGYRRGETAASDSRPIRESVANETPLPVPLPVPLGSTTTAGASEPEPDPPPDPNADGTLSRFARWAGRPLRSDERRRVVELVTWAEGEPDVTVAGQTVPLVALLPEAVEEGIRAATYNGPGPACQFVTSVLQRCIDQGVRPGQWVDSKAAKPKPAPKVRYGAM